MSGDAQSGSAFRLLPAVFRKLKNPCQAHRLRGGIVCGEALGAAAKSVLHLQKDRCFKEQKICVSSSALLLLTGNDVPWARGVPARSVLHLQKTRCLEGAGKAALELPRAPSTKILHLKLPRALHLESHIRNRLTPLNQESLTCRLNLLCFIEISFPLVLK